MQKQEVKAQLRSRELEDCGSGRGYKEMSHVYDGAEAYDGQVTVRDHKACLTLCNYKCIVS